MKASQVRGVGLSTAAFDPTRTSVDTDSFAAGTEITELCGRPASQADLRHVPVVGAAAATEHIDLWMTLAQITILGGELHWITVIEINRLV